MPPTPTHLSWPVSARPKILLAGRFPLSERNFTVVYRHPTNTALHLHAYAGTWRIGRREFALAPGDLTLSPQGQPTAYHLPQPGHHLCIHFTLGPRPGGPRLRLPLHLRLGARQAYVSQRLRHIIDLTQGAPQAPGIRPLALAAAGAALQELLIELAMWSQAGSRPADPRPALAGRHAQVALDRLVELIDSRLAEPVSVAEMSDRVGLTQNYMARLFRRRFGLTIQRYRLHRRIELAEHLLTSTRLPVHLIARRVGLPDPQHFNKAFRRLMGISPTQTRQSSS